MQQRSVVVSWCVALSCQLFENYFINSRVNVRRVRHERSDASRPIVCCVCVCLYFFRVHDMCLVHSTHSVFGSVNDMIICSAGHSIARRRRRRSYLCCIALRACRCALRTSLRKHKNSIYIYAIPMPDVRVSCVSHLQSKCRSAHVLFRNNYLLRAAREVTASNRN